MRKQQLRVLIILTLVLPSFQSLAQGQAEDYNNQLNPKSALSLGVALHDKSKSDNPMGVKFTYERFLTPNWSVEGNLFGNLFNGRSYGDFSTSRLNNTNGRTYQNYRVRFSFSASANYYFKNNSYDGHYLSFAINNLTTFSDRAEYDSEIGGGSILKRGRVQALPVLSAYYGYRKTFKSGFFVEGKIGLGYRVSPDKKFEPSKKLFIDGQLSVGWRLLGKKRH